LATCLAIKKNLNMNNTATSPLNPYVRLVIDENGIYILEAMFNTPQACVDGGSVLRGDYVEIMEVTPPAGISYVVSFNFDQTERNNEELCHYAVTTVKLDNAPARPTGGIEVIASWIPEPSEGTGGVKGPETPGKTVIQFEDAEGR
jgi:hypothetical protein